MQVCKMLLSFLLLLPLSSSLSLDNATVSDEDDEFANESAAEYEKRVLDFIYSHTFIWVMIPISVMVFVVGLIGNALVCMAVYRNHTMRTVTNYFIVNLAIGDFLVILICLPPTILWDATLTWFFGTIMCKIVMYLQTLSVTVSVLTLTFISVDRWYAICFPLRFKSTTRRAKTCIAVIWIMACLFDIPELVVYEAVPFDGHKTELIYFTSCLPSWSQDIDVRWALTKIVLLYLLPLAFMTITYTQIVKMLWKANAKNVQSEDNYSSALAPNISVRGQVKSRKKAAKMLVCVVSMFALCYFPVHLLTVLRLTIHLKHTPISHALAMIAHWLCYVNSAINPLIYNFMNGKFRAEFRRFFFCCSRRARANAFELHRNSNNFRTWRSITTSSTRYTAEDRNRNCMNTAR